MPTVNLLNAPKDEKDWNVWSFSKRISMDRIRQAIQTELGVNLADYQLDPIPFNAFKEYLERNAQAHIDMNNALGLQSADLKEVDIKDPNQLQAWVYLNWQEIRAAETALGI